MILFYKGLTVLFLCFIKSHKSLQQWNKLYALSGINTYTTLNLYQLPYESCLKVKTFIFSVKWKPASYTTLSVKWMYCSKNWWRDLKVLQLFEKNDQWVYLLISWCFYQVKDGEQYKEEVRLVHSNLRKGRVEGR